MLTIPLRYCEDAPETRLQAICGRNALRLSPKVQLASYPGALHWHLSHPQEPGTLEVTWWPKERRLWMKVASNREGRWIDGAIATLGGEFDVAEGSG